MRVNAFKARLHVGVGFLNARDSSLSAAFALNPIFFNALNSNYLTYALEVAGHELLCVIGGGDAAGLWCSKLNMMTVLLLPTWSPVGPRLTKMVSSSICVSLSSRHRMCRPFSVNMPL